MNSKIVIDNLGKIKAHQFKAKGVELLPYYVKALREICKSSAPLPTSLRAPLREATAVIAKDTSIETIAKKKISYNPGNEKELLEIAERCHNFFSKAATIEKREDAQKRKLRMDKALNIGYRLLKQNKISEADQAFQEAVKCYKNEHKLFILITKALCEAQQYKRATTYLKKAKEIFPADDAEVLALTEFVTSNIEK